MGKRELGTELLSIVALRIEWDERARQGVDLVAHLRKAGTAHLSLVDEIRSRRKSRRAARAKLSAAIQVGAKVAKLRKRAERSERKYDKSISRYLDQVQKALTEPGFSVSIAPGPPPKGGRKQTYRLVSSSYDTSYFASRVLTRDLRRAFGVRSAGRNDVVRAFSSVLAGRWPKSIVRADIESFYETVPHHNLIDLIDQNHALSPISKNWVRQMLSSYSNLSTPPSIIGLPRGVGPSAALADAYLQKLDNQIRDRKECVYYGRYVDDIVAVMAPTEKRDAPVGGYLATIQSGLTGLGLSLSKAAAKRVEKFVDPEVPTANISLDFLGYKIDHDASSGSVRLDLSDRRTQKVKARMDRAFDVYLRSHSREGESARLLELRLRFLTGNTRLVNSKQDAFVGVKFSSPLVTANGGLKTLDKALRKRMLALPLDVPSGVKTRLAKHGFERGFSEVRYVRFSDRDWRQIVAAWSDIV